MAEQTQNLDLAERRRALESLAGETQALGERVPEFASLSPELQYQGG